MDIRTIASMLLAGASIAHAGSPSGPRIVWVNLESDQNVTKIIKTFVDSQPAELYCGDSGLGSIFYIEQRPHGISDSLVRQALVEHNLAAKKVL